jgi:hypothetical protein
MGMVTTAEATLCAAAGAALLSIPRMAAASKLGRWRKK